MTMAPRRDRRQRGTEDAEATVLAVPALVVDVELGLVVVSREVTLGQRGSIVGPFGLGADEHDPAGEALLARGLGRLGASEAAPTMTNV
jgi:hypothetical protein